MKRLISLTVSLMMLMLFASFNTYAAQTDSPSVELSVSETAGADTVEVYVSLKNNPGIISARCSIEYDEACAELCSVQDLGLLKGYSVPSPTFSSPYILRWSDSLARENNTSNGDIAKLTFRLKNNESSTEIKVSIIESRNFMGEKLSFDSDSALITVKEETDGIMLGDIDGDKIISAKDVNLIKKSISGFIVLDEERIVAGDMNRDCTVNAVDMNHLIRSVSGMTFGA